MASNELIKELRYLIVDCILTVENENQLNKLNKILDKLNMMVKSEKV